MSENISKNLKTTALFDIHKELGAKLVPFAGWNMPIQFSGVVGEHTCVRKKVGLFDVSHMGQISIWGDDIAQCLERLVPGDIIDLAPWALRYTQLLNSEGGAIALFSTTRLVYSPPNYYLNTKFKYWSQLLLREVPNSNLETSAMKLDFDVVLRL